MLDMTSTQTRSSREAKYGTWSEGVVAWGKERAELSALFLGKRKFFRLLSLGCMRTTPAVSLGDMILFHFWTSNRYQGEVSSKPQPMGHLTVQRCGLHSSFPFPFPKAVSLFRLRQALLAQSTAFLTATRFMTGNFVPEVNTLLRYSAFLPAITPESLSTFLTLKVQRDNHRDPFLDV
jgi:hypothetical protein